MTGIERVDLSPSVSVKSEAVPDASLRARTHLLYLLTAAAAFNTIDRQALTLLTGSIRNEFNLTDGQVGFIGLSYGLLYALCAAPMAALADHTSRRAVISGCVAAFSAATVFCGLAPNYLALLLSRMGLAIAESGTAAPSRSIIADMYPRRERTFPMTIFSVASKPGGFIAFLLGGWLAEWFGWRWAFIILGAPGLLLTLPLLLMREPTCGASDGITAEAAASRKPPKLGEVLSYLKKTPTFWHMLIGGALHGTFALGAAFWMPIFLQRTFGASLGVIGTFMAFYTFVFGSLGVLTIGWIAHRLEKRDFRWPLWVSLLCSLIGAPLAGLMFMAGNPLMAALLAIIPAAVTTAASGPTNSIEQSFIPARMRTFVDGLSALITGVAGMGLGPQLFGLLSDALKPEFGAASIRYAMLIGSLLWVWAGLHYLLAIRTLKKDVERATAYNAAQAAGAVA